MPIATFDDVKSDLHADGGSLCDVYVLKSSIDEWDAALHWMSSQYALELSRDGMGMDVPNGAKSIFESTRSASMCLKVRVGDGVQANAHFFTEDEIEFDFDRKELNAESWKSVQAFILGLSVILDREVIFL
jgi:hypothetical protein